MSEKEQLLFMQVRMIRLAAKKWNMPVQDVTKVFRDYNVMQYIEVGYGIFHCEGDEAIWEDITNYLARKGCILDAKAV